MIEAKFDIPKLEKSLRRVAKIFGDSNRTAIARWGVQACRELAVSTQVFGKGGARKKQVGSIDAGIYGTIVEVTEKVFRDLQSGKRRNVKIRNRWATVNGSRLLADAGSAMAWIESNRGSKGRTKRMSQDEIGVAPKSVVSKVRKMRRERAGMAKGAWLGAGADIARRQRGGNRLTIGKNFLGYAQKHASRGSARATADPFRPLAYLRNKARHAGSSYVVSAAAKRKAVGFGLRKTLTWYRRAIKSKTSK